MFCTRRTVLRNRTALAAPPLHERRQEQKGGEGSGGGGRDGEATLRRWMSGEREERDEDLEGGGWG